MKRFLAAALAASMLLTLTACSGGEATDSDISTDATVQDSTPAEDTSDVSTSAPAEDTSVSIEDTTVPAEPSEPEIDYSSLTEDEIYDLMVERSLMTLGDTTRMSNVLRRAANGEEITAAFIGGSITEGYHDNLTLDVEQKWAKMTCNWLGEQYPDATINYVNAGLSGTPSLLGNMRLERDVLSYDPDIVFVEFAVNDGNATEYKKAYESLVRTLLENERDIAVVLLFTIVENGHTCQPHMSEIGENYDLPMISLPDSIWVEMQEGRMTWDDYSGDQSHPHVEGSLIILDFIVHYFEELLATGITEGEVDNTLPEAIFSGGYTNMKFLESTTEGFVPELVGFSEANVHHWFPNGWQFRGDTGASIKFDITCKKLGMILKANNSAKYGTAEIYVDGELVNTVTSNYSDGWNNPVTAYLIDNDESASHTVEVRIPEGEAVYFGVMGFAYNE